MSDATDLTNEALIAIRRHLHAHPELSLKEFETKAYLKGVIQAFDQTHISYREVESVPTALLVRIAGSAPQRTIGYRTDIDALPVTEATDLSFQSQNSGIMHACGHDMHMTVALGILNHFANHQPKDNLVFLFQPAEENFSGGERVYKSGALSDEFLPEEIYGLHDNPELASGVIATRLGTLFAGTTEIHVTFTGEGGHAAFPHRANDAIIAASAFVMQVQTIVSRRVDPIKGGVVTLGTFTAGTIGNVIAETAHINGTIRGLQQDTIELIQGQVRQIAKGIGVTYGVTVDLELRQDGYLPVENNPDLTQQFITYMTQNENVDFQIVGPAMTGEDFGYLLSKIPGTMFWLGVESPYALHSSHLAPKETALEKGVQAMTGFLEWRMQQD